MPKTTATGNPIHCTCNGSGKYIVENEDGFVGALSTHLCPCRLKLPPREGEASWWTEEHIETRQFEHALITAEASISRERPVSEDNYRLIRTPDNRYYPVMATLEIDVFAPSAGLTSDAIRSFAAWLNELAGEVDRLDEEVS